MGTISYIYIMSFHMFYFDATFTFTWKLLSDRKLRNIAPFHSFLLLTDYQLLRPNSHSRTADRISA